MKILKRGDIRLKTKTFECKGCGTVYEATEKEYTAADSLAYLHDGITAYCDCPICKKKAVTAKIDKGHK